MMLRTTISRIKKVCTVAFVPRQLRGDQRCPTNKFEIFSYAVLRKAQKSTKCTDDADQAKKGKQDDTDFLFVSDKKNKEKQKSDDGQKETDELFKENLTPLIPVPLKETHCETCQRIIDQAFGKDDNIVKPILGEQYFSTKVDLEETRREIKESEMAKLKFEQEKNLDKPISDDRVQFGVFKTEPIFESQPVEPEIDIKDSLLKPTKGSQPIEDISLMQHAMNIQMTTSKDLSENFNKIETVLDVNKVNTTSKKHNLLCTEFVNESLPLKEIVNKHQVANKMLSDMNTDESDNFALAKSAGILPGTENINLKDALKRETCKPAMGFSPVLEEIETKALFKPTFTEQSIKDIYVKSSKNLHTAEHSVDDGQLEQDNFNIETHLSKEIEAAIIQATTATENEEQLAEKLAQKLEHIEETPLVEAQNPKIEGFNVAPRVLGDMEPAFSCFGDKKIDTTQTGAAMDVPSAFDEVAKRCLDTPAGKIDEILLKEMEKLGIPVSTTKQNHGRIPLVDDDLVQMDVLKKQPRGPQQKELELASQECERGALGVSTYEQLYPTRFACTEKVLPGIDEDETESSQLDSQSPATNNVDLSYPTVSPAPVEAMTENLNPAQLAVGADIGTPLDTQLDSSVFKKTETTSVEAPVFTQAENMVHAQDKTSVHHDKTDENFSLHPNQVLIDPFDKKTLMYDTGEYDPAERYDPTKKFSYYYVPGAKSAEINPKEIIEEITKPLHSNKEILTGTAELSQTEPLEQETAVLRTQKAYAKILKEDSYDDNKQFNNAGRTWTDVQLPPKPETIFNQVHAKKMQDTPMFYQTYEQNNYQQQSGMKYHPSSYYPRNVHTPYYMWGEQQMVPNQQTGYNNNASQNLGQMRADSGGPDEQQINLNQGQKMNSSYKNSDSYEHARLCVPDGFWDKRSVQSNPYRSSTEAYNKTNLNVSDDIWDEQLDTEVPTKPKDSVKLNIVPNIWEKEQLDPKHVLTCNETCPISIRSKSEVNQFVDAETIFEEEMKDTHGVGYNKKRDPPEFDSLPKGATNEQKMDRLAKCLSTDQVMKQTATAGMQLPKTLNTLPDLKEDVALSELLRRVRERSRIIECKNDLKALGLEVEPAEGKCGRKAPRCPPLAPRSPPVNPIPPPGFGLPTLKPRPPACKPKKKTNKCSSCEMDVSHGLQLGPKISVHASVNSAELGADVSVSKSKADLTEEVIDRLQALGRILGGILRPRKTEGFDVGALVRNRRGSKTLLARDYEPWTPIPSWPTPRKPERKRPPCTPGCKIFPPPRVSQAVDPPCNQRPCVGFPKKTFSLLDCFAVSLGENKVYDLGEF